MAVHVVLVTTYKAAASGTTPTVKRVKNDISGITFVIAPMPGTGCSSGPVVGVTGLRAI